MLELFANHKYADEAGQIARMFFPGEKICSAEAAAFAGTGQTPGSLLIVSELRGGSAYAEVRGDGAILSHFEWPFSNNSGFLTHPRMLMLALYHALQEIKPIYAPWGSLTGIRPTKLARQWLDMGLCEEDIVSTYKNPYCVSEEKARFALDVAKTENRLAKKINDISDKAVGFYINIPFCETRCLYCSFNCMDRPPSYEMQELYISALAGEIREKAKQIRESGQVVSSIYIGGGTPTFLHEVLLEKMLYALGEVKTEKTVEFTVEGGRPDSVTKEKINLLTRYGATRFCVNPQTLNDSTLVAIGRKHTADDFYRAFRIARDAGIKSISADVIVGLPGETLFDMDSTMEGVVKLMPENITVHNLAIKRASKLKLGLKEADLPYAETAQKMLGIAQDYVKSAGYRPYYLYRQKDMVGLCENVGYSLDGFWCLYNVAMMSEVQTVIGAGAGAVSKFVEGSKITRQFNVKNPEIYIERRV